MKALLEPEDIDLIVNRVVEAIRPLLNNSKTTEPDTIFTVQTLAAYLGVEASWVYKAVSLKEIPYFKAGKYTRFRKAAIDKWSEAQTVRPIPPLKAIGRHRAAS